jgi:hypothetical protein
MLLPEGEDLTETESQPKIIFTGNEEIEDDTTVGKSTKPEVILFMKLGAIKVIRDTFLPIPDPSSVMKHIFFIP